MLDVRAAAEAILSELPELTLSKKKELIFKTKPVPKGVAFLAWLEDRVPKSSLRGGALHQCWIKVLSHDLDFAKGLLKEILSILHTAVEPEEEVPLDLEAPLSESFKCPLKELTMIFDPSEDGCYLYDPVLDIAHFYKASTLDMVLAKRLEANKKQAEAYRIGQARVGYSRYEPFEKGRLFEDKSGHLCFNYYNAPTWTKGWVPDPNATLPEEIKKFMAHFVPCEKERAFMLSILRDITFSRAEPILVLRGFAGAGKNIFAENIAEALVGEENKGMSPFRDSGFNAAVGRSRLYLLDETELNRVTKDKLKNYHNGRAVLEDKFKRVTGPQKIYASFVLLQNSKDMTYMEYSDRKFYVPTLATTSYESVTPPEEIDHMCKVLLKDDEYIRRIASYLFHRKEKLRRNDFKTPAFMDLCWYSLPVNQKKFFSMAVSETEFSSMKYYGRKGSHLPRISYDSLIEAARKFEEARGVASLGTFTRLSDDAWSFKSLVTGHKDLIPEISVYKSEKEEDVEL